MTLFDVTNSFLEWGSFDWANKVDTIWKTTICQKRSDSYLEQYIKMVLSWVVMSRIIITHLYTISYIANFYSIMTWSREKMLIPWLTMSAFKNFFLESIVLFVIFLLYLEGNLSGFLFSTAVFEKMITMALAAHNWNAINALYMRLKERDSKTDKRNKRLTTSSIPFNIMIGMNMQRLNLNEDEQKKGKIISLPTLSYLSTDSIDDIVRKQTINKSKSLIEVSSLKNHQQDRKRSSSLLDDFQFSPVTKVLKVLDFTNKDVVDEVILAKHELNDNFSDDSVSEIIHVIENESDDVDSKTSTCVCLPDKSENEITTLPEESFNIDLSKDESCSVDDLERIYSEWSRQWDLGSMLRSYYKVETKETEYDIGISYDEKCCQWSSSEDEMEEEINEMMKEEVNTTMEEEINKTTKEEIYEEYKQILNDLITTVFLELESQSHKSKEKNIPEVKMKSIETQTTKNNSFRTRITQTSLNELPSIQYNSYNMQMLKDLSKKDNMYETIQDRERKELEALKVYNALTLWKYKEEKDKISLSTMKASTLDKFTINTSTKITDNLKTFESFHETFDDSQIGRELDRSRAIMNIPRLFLKDLSNNQLKIKNNRISIIKTEEKQDLIIDNITPATRVAQNSKDLIDLKTKIRNIDWALPLSNLSHSNKFKKANFEPELSATDFIDEYDTIPLLQSAFSFDPRENVRGFYLGPASTDLYSVSEQIPDVFHEIIKTARSKAMSYDCFNYPSTQDIDFGQDYLKNWRTIHENSKDELLNKEAEEVTNIRNCENLTITQDPNDTTINHRNNFLPVKDKKINHYFDDDDDSDWFDEVFSTDDYFSKYIRKQDSFSDFSSQSNMSEFQTNDLKSSSTSSLLIL